MSDHAFLIVHAGERGLKPAVVYQSDIDSVVVRLGVASMHVPPLVAAELVDKILNALDVYAASLKAVA